MYLILFDVDGTLVDSQNIIFEGFARAFAAIGRPAPRREDVLAIIGRSLPGATATLLGIDEADPIVAQTVTAYKIAFQALRHVAESFEALYPGTRETIDALRARSDVILGIATGKSQRGVKAIIEAHGFDGLFATIQTADGHPSKPHPSMIMTALAETGVTPDRAIMIGDSSYDMLMARSAGVAALGVSWGYQDVSQLAASGAHEIVHDYSEVEPAIGRLLGW
jgi:phosphoglycolate phosphatase